MWASESSSCWILLISWCPEAFFELHHALLSLWHFPSPLQELFFSFHPFSRAVQFTVGLPFAELSSLLLAAGCVQVAMERGPGVAWSLNGALKATREVDKSLTDSSSAGGSPCQRIAFPLGSQTTPEEG